MTEHFVKELNQGNETTLQVQVPAKVFSLTERKDAVIYALTTHGRLYIWGTDGHSDWLKRGDQTDYPYCLVVVDPSYDLPDFVKLVPVTPDYTGDYPEATEEELLELELQKEKELENG